MTHIVAEPNSHEWGNAWAALAAVLRERLGNSTDSADEHQGERWQYMGTVRGEYQFRHRCYKGIARTYVFIPATDDRTKWGTAKIHFHCYNNAS